MALFRRLRGLILSWIVYWAVLAGVALGPMIAAIWRATRGPEGTGSVNVNFGNGVLTVDVSAYGKSIYSSSIHLLALAAWVAGPPLLAWIVWLVRRPRPEEVERERV